MSPAPLNRSCSIAIVGGGFSGTLVALNLIRQTTVPLSLYLIEKEKWLGKGAAYSTSDPYHLLNVPAEKMGAWPQAPHDFLQWLHAQEKRWRQADPTFASLSFSAGAYLPRKLYGLYLEDLLQQAQQEAKTKQVKWICLQKEAQSVQRNLRGNLELFFVDQQKIEVQFLVLATSMAPIKAPPLPIPFLDDRYISDIWSKPLPAALASSSLQALAPRTTILILGTGLTMVDLCVSLWKRHYPGHIYALSNQGKLPQKQLFDLAAYPFKETKLKCTRTIVQALKTLRAEIAEAANLGYDWRAVLEALREQTAEIWAQFPVQEQKRFIRLLLSTWNKHRHRMTPECGALLENKQQEERLHLLAGNLQSVVVKANRFLVSYQNLRQKETQQLSVDYIFNCLGPELNIHQTKDSFIQVLLRKGVLLPDKLGKGIQVNAHYQAQGIWSRQIYALGALLFGEKLETTAVTELRQQAALIAEHLLHAEI